MNYRYETYPNPSNTQVRKLKYYLSIKYDLKRVRKALEQIHSYKDPIITHSVFVDTIITYGRCFVSGDRTRLNIANFKSINPEERTFHELLMTKRNQYVAHAGDNDFETTKVIFLVNETIEPMLLDNSTILKFNFLAEEISLFLVLIDKILFDLGKRAQRIAENYLKSLTQKERKQLLKSKRPYVPRKQPLFSRDVDIKVHKEKHGYL